MRTGHIDHETGLWMDDGPEEEMGQSLGGAPIIEEAPVAALDDTPAARARAIKAARAAGPAPFSLTNYAPPENTAGPVDEESIRWAQRPDVMRANAAGRLESGHGTYEDRAAVGLPIPESQDHADAAGFAHFGAAGAAGELAAPVIGRGISSLVEKAKAIRAARAAASGPRPISDPAALMPVERGPGPREPDFWTPREGDHGEDLFETPSAAERTASVRVPRRAEPSTVQLTSPNFSTEGIAPRTVSAERGYVNTDVLRAEGTKGGAVPAAGMISKATETPAFQVGDTIPWGGNRAARVVGIDHGNGKAILEFEMPGGKVEQQVAPLSQLPAFRVGDKVAWGGNREATVSGVEGKDLILKFTMPNGRVEFQRAPVSQVQTNTNLGAQ